MSGAELQFINEAFEQNWIAPLGPNVDAFEHELGLEIGSDFVAAFTWPLYYLEWDMAITL
jgi:pyridoxal phosphate-dependent aminotransferase EpsN